MTWLSFTNDITLFLTHLGEAFTTNRLTQMVRQYVDAADIGKRGSCHLFRHTMAALMLENGADVRFIQAMLGHAKLGKEMGRGTFLAADGASWAIHPHVATTPSP